MRYDDEDSLERLTFPREMTFEAEKMRLAKVWAEMLVIG